MSFSFYLRTLELLFCLVAAALVFIWLNQVLLISLFYTKNYGEPGQSAVFYRGEEIVGGGIISN